MLALATGTWHIASVSWGKDSLAMLLKLMDLGEPLDEVVFFDTGMEFQAIYDTRDRAVPLLRRKGIHYTELRPRHPMWWSMFCRPVKKSGTSTVHRHGYGWCGGVCRWGTTEKQRALDNYSEAMRAVVYVGIAADETARLEKEVKPYKRHPLAEWGMTEADCLAYCYGKGFSWTEDDVPLYDVLDRVSCWCCRNKNLKELRAIHDYLPGYWERLVAMEQVLGPMKKGRTLPEIGEPC